MVSINGLKYELNDSARTATVVGYEGKKSKIVIPSKVKNDSTVYTVNSIHDTAFHDNEYLVCIAIPNTITQLGEYVFSFCENLTNIVTYGDDPALVSYTTFANIGQVNPDPKDNYVHDVIVDGVSYVDEHGIAYIDLHGRFSYVYSYLDDNYYDKPESHEHFDLNWE